VGSQLWPRWRPSSHHVRACQAPHHLCIPTPSDAPPLAPINLRFLIASATRAPPLAGAVSFWIRLWRRPP
jgi:hypothetical protein